MKRTLVAVLVGMILGVAGTLGAIEVTGNRYTYVTFPADECRTTRFRAEVVPNHPNPCHFRYRNW